jgi:hypothetical protein
MKIVPFKKSGLLIAQIVVAALLAIVIFVHAACNFCPVYRVASQNNTSINSSPSVAEPEIPLVDNIPEEPTVNEPVKNEDASSKTSQEQEAEMQESDVQEEGMDGEATESEEFQPENAEKQE